MSKQGKKKHDKVNEQKELHKHSYQCEKPISTAYPEEYNDLVRDNIENDIPAADLEDI